MRMISRFVFLFFSILLTLAFAFPKFSYGAVITVDTLSDASANDGSCSFNVLNATSLVENNNIDNDQAGLIFDSTRECDCDGLQHRIALIVHKSKLLDMYGILPYIY